MNPSNSNKRKNILYFSKYCQWSKKFQDALQKTNLYSSFVKVCIDTPGVKYPPWLERVPTVQIYDENDKRHILTDKECFEWINQKIETPIDLTAYNDGEMGSSISDCFSFLDTNQEATHSFVFLDALEKHWITTPGSDSHPGGGNSGQQQNQQPSFDFSLDGGGNNNRYDDSANQALEAYKRQRDFEVPTAPRGPTPQMEDKFRQEGGIGQAVDDKFSGQQFNKQLEAFGGNRANEIKRGPAPKHAPNFQTARFKSDQFQSHRGTGYQASGIGVKVNVPSNTFDQLSAERSQNVNYQQAPSNMQKPDFHLSARTYQEMQPQPQPQPQPQQQRQPQQRRMQQPQSQIQMQRQQQAMQLQRQQQNQQNQQNQRRMQQPPPQPGARPTGPPMARQMLAPGPRQPGAQHPKPSSGPPQRMMQRAQGPPQQLQRQRQRTSYSQQYASQPMASNGGSMAAGSGSYAKVI